MKTATYSFMYLYVDVVICFFTSLRTLWITKDTKNTWVWIERISRKAWMLHQDN